MTARSIPVRRHGETKELSLDALYAATRDELRRPPSSPAPIPPADDDDLPPVLDDEPPPPAPPTTPPLQLIAAGLSAVVLVGFALWAIVGMNQTDTPPAPATAAPVPSVAPSAAPQPSAVPTAATALLVAFWAPNGEPLDDPIDVTAIESVTGRYGAAWAHVRLAGGGVVWVRAAKLPARLSDALDAAPNEAPPTPAPKPPTSAPAPAAQPQASAGTCSLPDRPSHTSTRQVELNGAPLGVVKGVGCSQGEADANAVQLAAQMLEDAK